MLLVNVAHPKLSLVEEVRAGADLLASIEVIEGFRSQDHLAAAAAQEAPAEQVGAGLQQVVDHRDVVGRASASSRKSF